MTRHRPAVAAVSSGTAQDESGARLRIAVEDRVDGSDRGVFHQDQRRHAQLALRPGVEGARLAGVVDPHRATAPTSWRTWPSIRAPRRSIARRVCGQSSCGSAASRWRNRARSAGVSTSESSPRRTGARPSCAARSRVVARTCSLLQGIVAKQPLVQRLPPHADQVVAAVGGGAQDQRCASFEMGEGVIQPAHAERRQVAADRDRRLRPVRAIEKPFQRVVQPLPQIAIGLLQSGDRSPWSRRRIGPGDERPVARAGVLESVQGRKQIGEECRVQSRGLFGAELSDQPRLDHTRNRRLGQHHHGAAKGHLDEF